MIKVVGVRFKTAGKIYYFSPEDIDVNQNDFVIVETARGIEFGHVVIGQRDLPEEDIILPLKPVIRIATDEDFDIHRANRKKAKDAKEIFKEKVSEHNLEMEIIDVEYTFDNNKVIFYFTAEGRVDFRDLVKDLASIFRTRIELRQIGVRDQAKAIGACGACGREVCCKKFLGEFAPVSIKMAKDQSLSLNPAKISGVCGRLMCCLKYEHDNYEELLEKMPDIGTIVFTPNGRGTIMSSYTLLEQVKVKVRLEDGTDDVFFYHIDEIKVTKDKDKSFIKYNKPEEEKVNLADLKSLEE